MQCSRRNLSTDATKGAPPVLSIESNGGTTGRQSYGFSPDWPAPLRRLLGCDVDSPLYFGGLLLFAGLRLVRASWSCSGPTPGWNSRTLLPGTIREHSGRAAIVPHPGTEHPAADCSRPPAGTPPQPSCCAPVEWALAHFWWSHDSERRSSMIFRCSIRRCSIWYSLGELRCGWRRSATMGRASRYGRVRWRPRRPVRHAARRRRGCTPVTSAESRTYRPVAAG